MDLASIGSVSGRKDSERENPGDDIAGQQLHVRPRCLPFARKKRRERERERERERKRERDLPPIGNILRLANCGASRFRARKIARFSFTRQRYDIYTL